MAEVIGPLGADCIIQKTAEHYPFSVDQIKLPIKFEEFENIPIIVTIKQIISFNRIFIVPKKSDSLMQILDDILDIVDSGVTFSTFPPVHSVVVASYSDKNYYRATITKIFNEQEAEIKYIDLGERKIIKLEDILLANETIMKHRSIGYEVELLGVDETPDLILKSDFDDLMAEAINYSYTVETCSGNVERYTVNLLTQNMEQKHLSLSKAINELKVWRWKKGLLNGHTTDINLMAELYGMEPLKIDNIELLILPQNKEFRGTVSSYNAGRDIILSQINHNEFQHEIKVLNNQIHDYIDAVKSSTFFPTLDQVFLIYIKDHADFKDLHLIGVNKWNRCYRHSLRSCRNLDSGELYPLTTDFVRKHCIVRLMVPEFLKVPVGLVTCCIEGLDSLSDSQMEKFEKDIPPGKVVTFSVVKYEESQANHIITCPEIETIEIETM